MTAQTYIIRNPIIALNAAKHIQGLPVDSDAVWQVKIEPYKVSKSREQEAKYHAMLSDIARQYEHFGQKWKAEDMKRILVDAFKRDTIADPDLLGEWAKMGDVRMAPCIGGGGFVVLGEQTRRFSQKLGSAFIEWLYAFGAENNIRWSNGAS